MEIARLFPALGILGVALAIGGFLVLLILPDHGWMATILEGLALFCFIVFFVTHFQSFRAFSAQRTTRLGFNSILSVILAGAIVIIVNFLTARHAPSWDLSETQYFTLTRQTYQVLRKLDQNIFITVFAHERSPGFRAYHDLLDTYTKETSKITVNFVDPERQPDTAQKYKVNRIDTAVFESGSQKIYLTEPSEAEITNALLRVTQDTKKRILFLTEHGEKSILDGEPSGLSRARDALVKQGYEVDRLFLRQNESIPENISVLVIASPKLRIPQAEQSLIQDYVQEGGRLLLLVDPQSGEGLNELTTQWGVHLGKGIVVDERDRLGRGSPTALLVRTFTTHDITEDFTIPILLPVSRYIEFDDAHEKEWEFVSLAQTSPQSWAETNLTDKIPQLNPGKDKKGPFTVAAALSQKTSSGESEQDPAIVIVGNSAFASNGYLNYPGNTDFFLHIVAWLANEERLVSITPKEPAFRPFVPNPSQEQVLLFFQVLFLPSLILFAGFSIWRKRRRL